MAEGLMRAGLRRLLAKKMDPTLLDQWREVWAISNETLKNEKDPQAREARIDYAKGSLPRRREWVTSD